MIEEILERSINRALALDALSRDKMQQLAGKIIALEIEDLDRIIQLVPDKDSVQVRQWSEQPPDVTICGRFSDYLRGAAANLWAQNADGLYLWNYQYIEDPLGSPGWGR